MSTIILGNGDYLGTLFHHITTKEIPERLKKEDDKWVLGADIEELVNYLAQEYTLPQLELDPDRPATPKRVTAQVEYQDFAGYPRTTDQNQIEMTLYFKPHENLEYSLKFEASERVLHAVEVDFDEAQGSIRFTTTPNELERDVNYIKGIISKRNPEIARGNEEIRNAIRAHLEERRKKLDTFESEFDDILQKVDIPLKRKDISEAPIVNIQVRRQIEELKRPIVNPQEEFVLNRKYVLQVLEIMQLSGMQFELNPKVYGRKLQEEDLRDIMLAHLNTIFEGHATGETFSKRGKTDIHLRIQKGEIFISECKFWGGEQLYRGTIDQLFSYLTWRRNYAAIITFSRNKGFSDVLAGVEQSITGHSTYSSGFTRVKDSHFQSIHKFPEDPKKEVEIHHLVFNLYSE